MGTSVAVEAVTGKAVDLLPPGCRVPSVQGGGERNPARVILFVDDVLSVENQWREAGARY